MKGGGSFYQAIQYINPFTTQGAFKLGGGGARKTRRTKIKRGGFFPSLMGGVISNGPLLLTPAIAQAARLFRNESERKASRSRTNKQRKSRRSNRRTKNTRKA